MKYIVNANLVLENGILWDGVLVIEGNRIASLGAKRDISIPTDAEVIDAKGLYVGPGFVDIHVHGGAGYSTSLQPIEAAEYFLSHGTTTILATPCYGEAFPLFLEEIQTVNAARKQNNKAVKAIGGFYMEGPYMNVKYGSGNWRNPWNKPLDPTEYQALVDAAGDFARVWAIAPEREGLEPFMAYARKVNPNVKFAIGHSEATPSQIRKMKHYGLTIQTHSMNATGRLPVPGGTRGAGPDEYCMIDPDMYTELICDFWGSHVSTDIQRLMLHCKGVDKIVLITDCSNSDGKNPPNLAHVNDVNFDERGELSGSRLTMDQCCRNIMTHTNCGIAQAFLMGSRNPARAIGMDNEIGTIEVGKKANLVIVNDRFQIDTVILEGEVWNK